MDSVSPCTYHVPHWDCQSRTDLIDSCSLGVACPLGESTADTVSEDCHMDGCPWYQKAQLHRMPVVGGRCILRVDLLRVLDAGVGEAEAWS
jgi:hypothetical protein